ncbi:Uncharacterized protein HZ326_18510 [Fusarium oxysporum f. sp. albedinis]|jgi:hypothetical protein|nr:Uncharacterized protein HZ326_18510 [Fusarium oxysporum f. sp. albedinis]
MTVLNFDIKTQRFNGIYLTTETDNPLAQGKPRVLHKKGRQRAHLNHMKTEDSKIGVVYEYSMMTNECVVLDMTENHLELGKSCRAARECNEIFI